MAIAYSYVRFSTSEQIKGDSLRRQIQLSNDYIVKHNLTLDSSLNLQDLGFSAFDKSNVVRGALGGFLKAIEAKKIPIGSYLLIESLDRLSRAQVLDALQQFLSIVSRGVTIVTLSDGMVYNSETIDKNYSNLIVSITIMARAHEESAIKSRRIKAAWENKRLNLSIKKLTAQCPKWMKLNNIKTEFELIPEKVSVVMEIIELTKNGMGQSQIVKILNQKKIPPFSLYGNGWHSSSIQKILTSCALYGDFQPGTFENGKKGVIGSPVKNYYPQIISQSEFYLLQKIRADRTTIPGSRVKKGTSLSNLFSGIVKCGYCDSGMTLMGRVSRRVKNESDINSIRVPTKALVCDGGRRGLGCWAVQWPYKEFEVSFLMFCKSIEIEKIFDSISQKTKIKTEQLTVEQKLKSIEAEISNISKRLQNLLKAIESGDAPVSIVKNIAEYDNLIAILNDSRIKLERELSSIHSMKELQVHRIESLRKCIELMSNLTGEELLEIRVALAQHIREVIQQIKIYPAGRIITEEQIESIRKGLIESGYSESKIDDYMSKNYRTKPEKQGRGIKGRYLFNEKIGKYFTIESKNKEFRVIYPNYSDPSLVVINESVKLN